MKPELDRVKSDLEAMQRALGLSPSMGRDWVRWMKRDQWGGLWWCLPGFIIIAATLLPFDRATRYWGLLPGQWAGILVAAVLLGVAAVMLRKATARVGRPEGLVRESKRINGLTAEGWWFNLALVVQLLLYFFWGRHYRIGFEPFWAGLFLLMGSSCLVAAVAAKVWTLLAWAVPFLGHALCLLLVPGHGKVNGVLLGLMFIAVALSFSFISTLQIRRLERLNDPD
jgi:hypothetical protein